MDILIPNIEVDLSEQDLTIMSIHPDGRVLYTPLKGKNKGKMRLTKMVALPEHGRLISDTDVKALLRSGLSLDTDSDIDHVCGLIDGLTTIVEATE